MTPIIVKLKWVNIFAFMLWLWPFDNILIWTWLDIDIVYRHIIKSVIRHWIESNKLNCRSIADYYFDMLCLNIVYTHSINHFYFLGIQRSDKSKDKVKHISRLLCFLIHASAHASLFWLDKDSFKCIGWQGSVLKMSR